MTEVGTSNAFRSDFDNNFDLLRILAAYLVLISHAYPVFGKEPEFYSAFFGYETGGGLAVSIFFFISGYLLAGSLSKRGDVIHFFVSRALRILPALVVTVLLCALVIGPLVTTTTLSKYFSSAETWDYLRNVFMFPIRFTLPGVFAENPVKGSVNGSLWTLPIEVTCYILIFVLSKFKLLRPTPSLVLASVFISVAIFGQGWLGWSWTNLGPQMLPSVFAFNLSWYAAYFFCGAAFQQNRHRIPVRVELFACCILLLLASARSPAGEVLQILTVPYLIYCFAYTRFPLPILTKPQHDISYGVYVFAFPIQQSVYYFTSAYLGFWMMLMLTLAIVTLIGFASWKWIESPALRLKATLNNTKQHIAVEQKDLSF